jgi:succinoglycan biosynthesis transport protein ExoP
MTTSEQRDPATPQGISLRELWQVFLKRKWIVAGVAGTILVITAVASLLTTPVYTAKGQILIEREPNILSFESMFQVEPLSDDYFQTQYKLFQSRSVAGDTIDRLKLTENKAFLDNVLEGRYRTGVDPKTDPLVHRKLVTWFLNKLSVDPLRKTRLVDLSFTYRDPKLAADILNGLIDAYIQMNVDRKFQANSQATDFLTEQITKVRNEIEAKEQDLQEYGQAKNIVPLSSNETSVLQNLSQLNQAWSSARIERINKQTYYNEIKNAGPENIPTAMLNNPVVQRMVEEYNRLAREFARASETFLPDMPRYQQAKADLDAAKKALVDETQNQISRAYQDFQTALANEQALEAQFRQTRGESFQTGKNAIEYNILLSEIQSDRSLLETLMTRKSEADVSSRLKGLGASNIYVVDRAEIPLVPSSPRPVRNTVLGLMIGLFFGLGLALLYENLDVSIKDAEDVRKYSGMPTLGLVPVFPHDGAGRGAAAPGADRSGLGEKAAVVWDSIGQKRLGRKAGPGQGTDLLVQFAPDSTFAEQYRSIRTALLYSMEQTNLKALAVTSPLPQDGKTATVCNLAASLAQAGKKVVLVDGDLRKPRLHAIFRIKNLNGLSKYLMTGQAGDDMLRATPIPTLFVINAGPVPPDPSELLGSERMTALVSRLKGEFDYVLFDTPPALAVSDSLVLGSRLDGAILVVRRGKTPRLALKRAQEKLSAHKIKTLGVVINGVRVRDLDEYHISSYYGYRKRTDG